MIEITVGGATVLHCMFCWLHQSTIWRHCTVLATAQHERGVLA